jgi:hypothetical protein
MVHVILRDLRPFLPLACVLFIDATTRFTYLLLYLCRGVGFTVITNRYELKRWRWCYISRHSATFYKYEFRKITINLNEVSTNTRSSQMSRNRSRPNCCIAVCGVIINITRHYRIAFRFVTNILPSYYILLNSDNLLIYHRVRPKNKIQ